MSAEAWSAIANGVTASCAVAGAIAAFLGLATWQKELRGRNEYDTARRILIALYRFRDAIKSVRRVSMFGNEYLSRPDRKVPSSPIADADDLAFAYERRWRTVTRASRRLEVELIEGEALWGALIRGAKAELWTRAGILQQAIVIHIEIKSSPSDESLRRIPVDGDLQVDRVVFEQSNDEYGKRLATTIARLEAMIRPHLER